jgi:hypothetical protein
MDKADDNIKCRGEENEKRGTRMREYGSQHRQEVA